MITKISVSDCSSIININRLIDIDCHRLSSPCWNSLGNSSFSVLACSKSAYRHESMHFSFMDSYSSWQEEHTKVQVHLFVEIDFFPYAMIFTTLIFRLINMQISNMSVSRTNTTWRQASRVRTVAFLVSTTDSSKSKKPTKGSFFAGSVETILLYLHLPGIKLLFKNTNEETEVSNSSLYALGCHVPIPLSSVDKPPSWKSASHLSLKPKFPALCRGLS